MNNTIKSTFKLPATFNQATPIIINPKGIKEVIAYMPLFQTNGYCKTSRRFREGVFLGKNKSRQKLMCTFTIEALVENFNDQH